MKFRKLTSDGDWTFGQGIGDFATESYAIEFNIATRVREWVNDCFFAMDHGIDYNNLLEIGQQKRLLHAVRTTILQSYGVVGVNSVDVEIFNERDYIITYDIDTIYSIGFTSKIELI